MTRSTTFTAISIRLILFAVLWWAITEAAIGSWYVGVPVVVIATWVSLKLVPGFALSLSAVLRFIPFFLWHSLRGGVDVAQRALLPRLAIEPGMVDYHWRLPAGLARVFMANIVSLLPGTLSAELGETTLHLHVLDITADISGELEIIEQRVADIFALDLSVNKPVS